MPVLVARQQHDWQPKPPSTMSQWPMFVSVFSSYGDETLHERSAANGEEVPDQVEVYVMLSGVARLVVPYGKGKVAVYRLLPHSVAVV